MKRNYILLLSFLSMLFFQTSIAQTCSTVTFKTLYYENDSNLYATHTLNRVFLTGDNAYYAGGSQIMKTDLYGNRVWDTLTYNSFYQQDVLPYVTPAGDYYLLFSNFKLYKLDPNENIVWDKTTADTLCYCNQARHIVQTSDGGFIITGSSNLFDTTFYRYRTFVVKTNSVGDTTWTKTIAKTSYDNHGYYTQQTSDGGYLVIGDYQIDNTEFRIGVSKLNSSGQEQWFKYLPHHLHSRAELFGTPTIDNNIALTSIVDSTSMASILLKIDQNGDEIYHHILSGANNGALTSMNDGNLLLGLNDSLFKINNVTGSTIWSKAYLSNEGYPLMINSIQPSCDYGYIMTANAVFYLSSTVCCGSDFIFNDYRSYLIKVDSTFADPNLVTGIQETKPTTLMQVYPNPFDTETTISFGKTVQNASVIISDLLGKELKRIAFSGENLRLQKGDLAEGIYFIRLEGSENYSSQKIIIR